MKTFRLLSLAALSISAFAGCETTGNPNEGGIFWSETKAKDRLRHREATLGAVESDTARVQRSNRRLEGAAARKARYLEE